MIARGHFLDTLGMVLPAAGEVDEAQATLRIELQFHVLGAALALTRGDHKAVRGRRPGHDRARGGR